jgi:hypothetical protein
MKLLVVLVTVGLSAAALAGPVYPDLGGTGPWLGQGLMESTFTPGESVADVDFIVLGPGSYAGTNYASLVNTAFGSTTSTGYLYLYQVESHLQNLNILSLEVGQNTVKNFGFVPNLDLDTVHNIAGEDEPAGGGAPLQSPTNTELAANLTWFFGPGLDNGVESTTLWYTSDLRPTYGWAAAQDSIPPSPGKGFLPVPVPVPGAVILGLLGLAALRVRKT